LGDGQNNLSQIVGVDLLIWVVLKENVYIKRVCDEPNEKSSNFHIIKILLFVIENDEIELKKHMRNVDCDFPSSFDLDDKAVHGFYMERVHRHLNAPKFSTNEHSNDS